MADNALDSLPDPLITPILALLYDAINADLTAEMTAAGVPPDLLEPAVQTTCKVPFTLGMEGSGVLPALHCYRVRTRSVQTTMYYLDHGSTLQFAYATPPTGRDMLDVRWPLLDRVWHALIRTLVRGSHPAHMGGADVLLDAGVVRILRQTAIKRELFTPDGQQTFPGFVAEVDVIWRDENDQDQGPFYPALSFDAQLYTDNEDTSQDPDVIARVLTDAGEADPAGKDFPRPPDWSL
jgi:hypothetical protein